MSPRSQRTVELNEPSQLAAKARELRQHLVNASNELYLMELKSEQQGLTVSTALKRAHSSIRAELRRMETELATGKTKVKR